VCVVCCQAEVSATSWSLVKRSPTDRGVSLCVITKPRGRGGHSPHWAAEPEKIITITIIIIILCILMWLWWNNVWSLLIRIFCILYFTPRPALGPTRSPVQWVLGLSQD
jgi:hypothetical protein